jgi:hypothetical protein
MLDDWNSVCAGKVESLAYMQCLELLQQEYIEPKQTTSRMTLWTVGTRRKRAGSFESLGSLPE